MESIETQVDPVEPKGYIRPEGASTENLRKVHGWIKTKNPKFTVGFSDFVQDMSNEENFINTFLWLKGKNPEFVVDYDTFAQDMGFALKKKDLPQFGEDGSPENIAPLPTSSEKPLTASVPQPSELDQILNEEVAPNDLEQALAAAEQPAPVQTDFGSQSIESIDEQLRQEIKQVEDGEAPKIPDDAIEKAKKRNKSFESALNIQFEKQFEPELKKAQKQFEAEQKDKVKEIQSLVDKGSISVEKGNELLNKWQDKKQDELNESLTKQQEIKYDQFLEENKDFISKWQDIYQTQFDKDAAKPDLSFSPEKKVVGSDKPTPKQKLSRDELLANQFEVKKDRIKKLIKEEDKAKYAEKIKEVSKTLSSKIEEQLKKMPKDISFEDVGVGTPKVKTDEKRDVLRMAKDILKEIEDTPDQGGFLEGLTSKGLVNALPFISSVAEFPELSILKKAAEGDIKVGEKMGENELVLTANDLRNKFNEAKENPSSYRWGQVLADMVPYIVEYATTAGVYTTARAATTTALTNAIKASAKPIIKNAIIKPVSTLVGIAAQTAANPQRFIDTAVRRMTPQLQITLSEDGNEIDKYIAKPGEDFKTAFAKSFGVNALELLTERFGQWSNEAASAMKISGSWMPNVVLAKWMEKKGIATLAEGQKQARRIGWDGVFQEIWIEEYPNKILQNAVTGDEQWNPDFFNPLSQGFVDMIVPSLFLSGGPVAMAAVNKWASKGVPEDKAKANLEALKNAYKRPEQDISVPKGDLGKKPTTDEKPNEQQPAETVNTQEDTAKVKEPSDFTENQKKEYIDRGFSQNDNGLWVHKDTHPKIKEILNGWIGKLFAINGGTHAGNIHKQGQGISGSLGKFNFKTGKQSFLDLVFSKDKTEGDYFTTLTHELGHDIFDSLTDEEKALIESNQQLTDSAQNHKKNRENNGIDNASSDAEESWSDYVSAFLAKKIFNVAEEEYNSIPKEILPILEKNIKIPQEILSKQNANTESTTVEVPSGEQAGSTSQVATGKSTEIQETAAPQEKSVSGDPQEEVVRKISDAIGEQKLDKKAIEAIGKDAGITDKNEIKELSELAVVQKARELAKDDDFEGLVDLYNNQPNLTHRTNESISKQQYSTPAPIAYLMGKYIKGDQPGKKSEPSAGNGMLTIVGDPKEYTVNEIDPTRLRNLERQGFGEILSQDGSQDFGRPKQYDSVITNPPFGGTKAINIEGYKFNELAQIMAVRALDTMKDTGRGAIIIGGNNEFDDNGRLKGRDRIFFNYLFNKYNVDDVIDVSGDLYRKQGASFPIRVILVNGRKAAASGVAPTSEWFGEQAESFEDIKKRIDGFLTDQPNETIQPTELERGPAEAIRSGGPAADVQTGGATDVSIPGTEVQEDRGRGDERSREVEGPSPVSERDAGDTSTEPDTRVDNGGNIDERPVSEPTVGQGPADRSESEQPGRTEGDVAPKPRRDRKIAEGGLESATVKYEPLSSGNQFELMMPSGMQQEILDAQTDLENEVGDVDEFVRERLGYKNKEDLYKALGSEQIDGVALAIRNIERGTGIIIGDQTGVGKGRQAAALIRYGNMQGLTPIFLTEKPNLFTDLYRDLDGIDYGKIKPFIVNTTGDKFKGVFRGKEIVYKAPSASNKDHKLMLKNAIIPKDAKVILATYSQFSSPRYVDKINFLNTVGAGNIIILDEAHNASGQGNTNALFQSLLPQTRGVVYLSGTFAKRADNMPVYALKTSMREANLTTEDLIQAIEGGGVALQEIISSHLAESGEMIRRERSFKGIEVNNHLIGADNKDVINRQLSQADNVTSVMNEIIAFQRDHVKPVVAMLDKQAAREGEQIGLRTGTNMAGVDNTPYFSKVFNVINQLLYSIKAKDTAQMAIEKLKQGEKPFIAIRSTMEAMVKDIIERGDVKVGDAIDPDFRFVLRKGLEGVMRISVKDAQGESVKKDIPFKSLPIQSQLEYKRIMARISSLKTGLTISPIDEVIKTIRDAGYTVGEVTGRQTQLEFRGEKAILQNNKKEPVNELYRKYNNGDIDVLIVNSSGSTGASAHAAKEFKDQRQRHMLILEPELNISTLVQIIGRINRTGQIKLPKYTFVGSHIPAEQRMMMMTMRKLKSLDANTTSNQKQSNTILEVPEIFNKYGDQVVIEYLEENPEIIDALGDPLKMLKNGEIVEPEIKDGAANKVTGRVAILPTSKQADFYSEITDRYNTYLQFLNDAGMNDLEVRQLPLKSKTLKKEAVIVGKGGRSKFGEDTFLEEVEADVLKKPMTKVEVDKSIKELSTVSNEEYKSQLERYKQEVFDKISADEDEKLRVKIEKAKQDQSLDDQAKAQAIKELEDNSGVTKDYKIGKESTNIKYVETLFNFFTPGRAVKVPFDFDEMTVSQTSDAIFLGFDINDKKKKPFLRSNVILKFAVNDSRRLLSIPSSKAKIINDIRQNSYSLSESHQQRTFGNWDSLKKPKARSKRYIVTGNILQGLGNPDFRKGQIVKYTTQEGFINTGVVLSESFNPNEVDSAKEVSIPAGKVIPIIIESATGTTFESSDSIWKINKRTGTRYSLRVPKPKQTGGKYYLDDQINELVDNGRWDSVGNEMEAFTDASRLDQLLTLLGSKFSTSFNIDKSAAKSLMEQTVAFSERSASTYQDLNSAMATFIPVKVSGKVKKQPSNKALLDHLKKQNLTEAELQQQLDESLKFENEEAESRFQEANSPTDKSNITGIIDNVKDFFSGFKSHFKFLNERVFPREANILREFEGLKNYTTAQAAIYIRGLVEPLTKQQYRILERKIILSDLLESIEKGLNMEGVDGKLPFGFNNKVEVAKELKKVNEFANADPAIQNAFDRRNDFINTMRDALVNEGLLNPGDIDSYYHRRVIAYQHDDYNRSVIFGKQIGKKKRDFQRMRTGTRGMDYNTNFIETEFKVVAEGVYELEKQKILRDLMRPYEAKLQQLKKQFNRQFENEIDQLEQQFGKNSVEVNVRKDAKRALLKNFLMENIPDGYVFWKPEKGNSLFWANTISQQVLDRTMDAAKMSDLDGGSAVDIVDDLISDLNTSLAVGARRKNYMVPEPLAEQLEYMATPESIKPLDGIVTKITGEFKKIVLMAPNRILRYSLNNLGGDIDRTLQVEPKILKYSRKAADELWDYAHYGKTTPQLLEAIRGSVIDSGYELQELAALSKQQWVGYFFDQQNGASFENIIGNREIAETMAKKPSNLYDRYMEVARKYVSLRENVLRYAAYKLAQEKMSEGKPFYWASKKDAIDAISDPRQKIAKLAREVYGDYGNISYSGQQLRRIMIPFYSWFEINMGTHLQLIKNASSPEVQKQMVKSGLMRGIPYVTGRMAVAWSKLFLFTAAVEAWNYMLFPNLPWVDDDDKDAAEKLRRANVRGMQILLYSDENGLPKGLPIIGAFYDFVDFFGIPDVIDDIAMIFTGNSPAQRAHAAKKVGSTMISTPTGKAFQMATPLIKMPLEYATGQTYFPDPKNPIPIRDTGEWFFNALTLKDEYNYFFTDKPKKESYLSRKLTNSLLMREFDPDMLAYYQAKRIVSDYTGKRTPAYLPTNPTEIAKQKALYYYTLSMRYGNLSEANKHLTEYFMNGGNPSALLNQVKNSDPFRGLSKQIRPGEAISEYQDLQNAIYVENYQPFTRFVKQLTRDDILVMRDAMRYHQRLQGIKPKK